MKKILIFFAAIYSTEINANGVTIANVVAASTTTVSFDIAWNNSWNAAAPSNNWDAVWVFIKTQVCVTGSSPWSHALVATSTPGNHIINSGGGGLLQIDAVTDGMGVFIRRSGIGSGNIATANITLKLQSTYTIASTNYEVIGIEMVNVPQGTFNIGDGSTLSTQSFGDWGTGNTTLPYSISTEASIGGDAIRNDNTGSSGLGCCISAHNAIPAGFPKGFNAFYCMKYEISQQQYVTFLNLLDYNQQITRTAVTPNSAVGTLAMTTAGNENRNFIKISTAGTPFSTPAIYGYDLNSNGTLNEAADGSDVACNYLSWGDLTAYLDWSGLRPMSELEFEKAARGALSSSVLIEFPWGTTTINQAISNALTNAGQTSEISTSSLDGLCCYNAGASSSLGPLRDGFAATATSTRTGAGASFYGILDLGGNLWEQCMMAGYYTSATGRMSSPTFIGTALGDGALDGAGNSNPVTWSGGAPVSIVRGGNWEYASQKVQTSDRSYAAITTENATRVRRTGGRGVR